MRDTFFPLRGRNAPYCGVTDPLLGKPVTMSSQKILWQFTGASLVCGFAPELWPRVIWEAKLSIGLWRCAGLCLRCILGSGAYSVLARMRLGVSCSIRSCWCDWEAEKWTWQCFRAGHERVDLREAPPRHVPAPAGPSQGEHQNVPRCECRWRNIPTPAERISAEMQETLSRHTFRDMHSECQLCIVIQVIQTASRSVVGKLV